MNRPEDPIKKLALPALDIVVESVVPFITTLQIGLIQNKPEEEWKGPNPGLFFAIDSIRTLAIALAISNSSWELLAGEIAIGFLESLIRISSTQRRN